MRNITKAISRTLLASPGQTSAIGDNKRSTNPPRIALSSVCEMTTLVLPRTPHIFILPFTTLQKMFELYELTEFWSEGILTSMARNSISTVAP